MQHFLVYEMVVVVRYFPLCKPIIVTFIVKFCASEVHSNEPNGIGHELHSKVDRFESHRHTFVTFVFCEIFRCQFWTTFSYEKCSFRNLINRQSRSKPWNIKYMSSQLFIFKVFKFCKGRLIFTCYRSYDWICQFCIVDNFYLS